MTEAQEDIRSSLLRAAGAVRNAQGELRRAIALLRGARLVAERDDDMGALADFITGAVFPEEVGSGKAAAWSALERFAARIQWADDVFYRMVNKEESDD